MMNRTPKVLVLVLGVDREPWRQIETRGQRATWAAQMPEDTQVRFYYGDLRSLERLSVRFLAAVATHAHLNGLRRSLLRNIGRRWRDLPPVHSNQDSLRFGVPETYVTIGVKTIAALRESLQSLECDYVFRCNSSSYVNLAALRQVIARCPPSGVYAGRRYRNSVTDFVSGAGILMSRDVCESLVRDSDFAFELADDVAIGLSCSRAGITITELERVNLKSAADVDALSHAQLATLHHFRCKVAGSRESDIDVMLRLHDRILMLPDGFRASPAGDEGEEDGKRAEG